MPTAMRKNNKVFHRYEKTCGKLYVQFVSIMSEKTLVYTLLTTQTVRDILEKEYPHPR